MDLRVGVGEREVIGIGFADDHTRSRQHDSVGHQRDGCCHRVAGIVGPEAEFSRDDSHLVLGIVGVEIFPLAPLGDAFAIGITHDRCPRSRPAAMSMVIFLCRRPSIRLGAVVGEAEIVTDLVRCRFRNIGRVVRKIIVKNEDR